ncbi:MAG: methyltransferase domain-containing protein [Longimicrobiales bacterium]|nr:methyltransferase domain-containing protein [Longimicrobiales bacterium]
MRATWLSSFITDTVYLAVGAWSSRLVGSPLQRAMARSRYEALAASYDDEVIPQDGYLAPIEAALDRLPTAPAEVLDVSTGTGAVVGVLMQRFPGCRGAAVDLSPVMLAHAARHARERGWSVRLAAADAGCLPFRAGTFDLVTVQNAFPVPGELVRVVRPGGWVVMSYSAGGSVLPWIVRSLTGQLRALGCQEVETRRVGSGRYFLAQRPGGTVYA